MKNFLALTLLIYSNIKMSNAVLFIEILNISGPSGDPWGTSDIEMYEQSKFKKFPY